MRRPSKAAQNRQLLGARLKVMLSDLALTPETAAQMLHVTPRTVRYWISGKVLVPYAAYRLLRILRGAELPANGWDGWHMHSGKLWSPEGFRFVPSDSSWWAALVRKARLFKALYDRNALLEQLMIRAGRDGCAQSGDAQASHGGALAAQALPTAEAGAAKPPRLNLSLGHFRTHNYFPEGKAPFQTPIYKFASTNLVGGAA